MDKIEALQSELQTLKMQLQALETAKINASTIPAEELLYLHDRIGEMHKYLAQLAETEQLAAASVLKKEEETMGLIQSVVEEGMENPQVLKQDDIDDTRDYSDMFSPPKQYAAGPPRRSGVGASLFPRQQPPPVPKKRRGFSELNFGKYAAGVVAAVLVFLAAVSFVGLFWESMPPAIKFLLVLSLGLAGAVGGGRKVVKQPQNGFWLALCAAGFGVIYISISMSAMTWELFPPIVALILLIGWFGGCFTFARKISSIVFYLITYLGGAICVSTAGDMLYPGLTISAQVGFSLLVVALLSFGIYSDGHFRLLMQKDVRTDKQIACDRMVTYLNMALGFFVLKVLGENFLVGSTDLIQTASLLHVMMLIVAGFLSFSIIQHVENCLLGLLLNLPAAAFYVVGAHLLFHQSETALIPGLVCVGGAAAILALCNRDFSYAVWCIFPFITLGAWEVSYSLLGFGSMLIFLLAVGGSSAGFFYYTKKTDAKENPWLARAFFGIYCLGFICYINDMVAVSFSFYYAGWMLLLSLLYPLMDYYLVGMDRFQVTPYQKRTWDIIFAIVSMVVFQIPIGGLTYGPPLFALIMLTLHKLLVLNRAKIPEGDWRGLTDWRSANVGYLFCLFMVSVYTEAAILTWNESLIAALILVWLMVCYTMDAVQAVSGFRTAMMMALSHLHIFLILGSLHLLSVSILASIMGLLLCALFTVLGFMRRNKKLRVMGLITMMIYVLKITLVDISLMAGSPALTIMMLLMGGLICFGISYAYNKLEGKLKKEENSEDDFE